MLHTNKQKTTRSCGFLCKNNYMQFDLLTIFPDIFNSYIYESIIGRAQKEQHIQVNIHNIRDYAEDKHKTTDDKPYGGGVGMIMKIEPLYKCLKSIPRLEKSKAVLMSPRGKLWDQQAVQEYVKEYDQLIIICGRYEGVDERILNFVDEEISIGNYVLTGGELGAAVLVDSLARLVPGVLGKGESADVETHSKPGYIEYGHYTRPEAFTDDNGVEHRVPDVLLSGHHAEIEKWRQENAQ